jgi:pimeloyl-ACP methyl ester carboxylesterase
MKTASTVARRTLDDLQSPPTGVSAPGTGVSAPGIETPVVLPVGALGARAADTPWPASSGSSDMSPLIPRRLLALLVAFIALLAPAVAPSAQAASKPTIVLVHGAFADASGWNGEIARLERHGYHVVAPANPLRGVSADAAYLRAFLATIKGPIVLVGHSYGGFVITNAATGNPNVKALVYVAGYSPDTGDSVQSLGTLGNDGRIGPATLDLRPYPAPEGSPPLEGYIKLGVFRDIFAADLPRRQARAMARTQRPAALAALSELSGEPAWKTIPSWYLVPTRDRAIGTDVLLAMAKRIHPRKIVRAKGASHVVMISRPKLTTQVIVRAARSIR